MDKILYNRIMRIYNFSVILNLLKTMYMLGWYKIDTLPLRNFKMTNKNVVATQITRTERCLHLT